MSMTPILDEALKALMPSEEELERRRAEAANRLFEMLKGPEHYFDREVSREGKLKTITLTPKAQELR